METKQYKENLLLLFESADGGGKDTLIDNLQSMEQFKNIEMKNRSTISERIYADKFRRDKIQGMPVNVVTTYWEYWFEANKDTRIILCNPSSRVLAARCIEKNEPFCRNRTFEQVVDYIEKDRQDFYDVSNAIAKLHNFDILVLDTNKSIPECIEQIEEFIEDARI